MSAFPSRTLLTLVAGGIIATPVRAQLGAGSSRPVSIVVSAGAAVPTGGFKDYHDVGMHGDVSVIVRLAGQAIRLRPELSYHRFALKEMLSAVVPLSVAPSSGTLARTATFARAIPGDGSGGSNVSSLLSVIGNLELPLTGGLYLIGGVGASQVKTGATETAGDASETALTYTGGAGVRFRLGAMSAFVEGRLQNLSIDEGKALFTGVRTVPVTVGIVF